ncbi:Set1 complex component spp1 [Cytospora mali]|uniref:Set1 complex component spp1 n=1 Tax=Cytospora mali TaxID=578113 RepID=A0A194WAH8_CYTMA|nr:Set1 complex component spp1 [Valsa mali]
MDIDASEPPTGSQDLNIKRETSSMDDDARMSEIPESGDTALNGPRSTQPSQLPVPSQTDSEAKPPAAARATSKKGTAKLIKKPIRKGNGSTSRGGRSSRGGSRATASASRKKSTASQASSPPSGFPGSSEAGGSDDEESDHGPYCICRGPDDHRWMISCDMCDDWFHGECVQIDKAVGEALIQRYVCPRCADDQGINVTRYKKTCSLEGCLKPARIYENVGGAAEYSVFCSDRHAEEWWEQLVRSLPENRSLKAKKADLTREKFMGLLNVSTPQEAVEGEEPWRIGKRPFAVPPEFWSKIDQTLVFTPEEQAFLTASAADRYALAEEIVLNKKMQQILDLANERRKVAISEGLLEKDVCGYDARLNLVGCPDEFSVFVKSPQGEAIYKNNSLTAEGSWTEEQTQALKDEAEAHEKEWDPATAGMCDRRRCKPHASWYNIFTKSTRHVIKELARQAKEKLDAETRVREAAATRYYRRRHERTAVTRLDGMVMT